MLPRARHERRPSDDPLVADSIAVYERIFAEAWRPQSDPRPWGHWKTLPERMRRHYRRMRPIVDELAPARGDACLDISAGNGTLSLALGKRFDVFVAADLSVAAVNFLSAQPGTLALRTDYLRSPYRPGAFDFVLCTDTLVYGRDHEEALLCALWSAVAPGGSALLQFHHRLHHNPLTPPVTIGYTRDEILAMLAALRPAPDVELTPFFQEFDGNLRGGGLAALARRAFPPTRFFVTARKPITPAASLALRTDANEALGPDQRGW
jgi:SAM-dependent methyltransferase